MAELSGLAIFCGVMLVSLVVLVFSDISDIDKRVHAKFMDGWEDR